MKKVAVKDKKTRINYRQIEKSLFILNSICKNTNFFTLIRLNSFIKLNKLSKTSSKVSFSNRCVETTHKKCSQKKLSKFSRHIFLRRIRSGKITGIQKASW